ncbi:hypothetical protein A2U01_0025851 [Trifolium medium]|uniref:Uncharacterized protein n=1 Tax=Trifolium medium TaxID=97028 RepID=A0A392NYC5_9FABA|nr:hypothetical protein [Trifolium medium]
MDPSKGGTPSSHSRRNKEKNTAAFATSSRKLPKVYQREIRIPQTTPPTGNDANIEDSSVVGDANATENLIFHLTIKKLNFF